MNIIKRILISPIVAIHLMLLALGTVGIWIIDGTYDHKAAIKLFGDSSGWIEFLFNSNERVK
jgi:hypothetical protein